VRARLMNIPKCEQAKAIMLMIQNRLCRTASTWELITYGGNGAVFQNWHTVPVDMQYLSEMTDEQINHVFWTSNGIVPPIKKHQE
jgi:urocanate hydratase